MGRIAAPHGVRGFVRMVAWSATPAALIENDKWWLRMPGTDAWREIEVTQARPHGDAIVAQLRGVESRDDAAALRGAEIALPQDALPPLGANEYYWSDLEGMDVVNRAGMRLGRIVGLMESGAHPLLRVAGDAGGGERLIPFVAQYIDRIDAASRRVDVDWDLDY